MSTRRLLRWTPQLLVVLATAFLIGWSWRMIAGPTTANATSSTPTHQTLKPITALPNVTHGQPFPGKWFTVPPDKVLPNGLSFEVTLGVITGIATREGNPNYNHLVGTRYQPADLDRTDVTRPLWRFVDLRLTKPDGSIASIQAERPLWWFDETGAKVGASVHLAMQEVGIEGVAEVLSVGPCNADSREGNPNTNLVIGKIEHENAVVHDLIFNNDAENPLGVTAHHPIFSNDRNNWVPAGELETGEKVRTVAGTATLSARSRRPGRHKVYNIEVHRSHSYHVSQFGILAHNTGIACELGSSARTIHDRYVQYVRPGARERVFKTPWTSSTGLGSRKFDDFDDRMRTAFEGNTTPWSRMSQRQLSRKLDQAGSDFALLQEGKVNRIIWFGTEQLPSKGLGAQLRDALRESGIEYWVVGAP